jgi:hypothetical protein
MVRHMRQFLDRASMSFAAGAFGALLNSLAVWAAGEYHLTVRLDIAIAPGLTPNWLYPRIVWGGLWGFFVHAAFGARKLVAARHHPQSPAVGIPVAVRLSV